MDGGHGASAPLLTLRTSTLAWWLSDPGVETELVAALLEVRECPIAEMCRSTIFTVMELSIQDELWWGADLCLSAWGGYQSRRGPYCSVDSPLPSNGSVRFIFAPEGRDLAPLNEQEVALMLWFERNEPAVSKAVKEALIDWCSQNNIVRNANFDFGEEFPSIASEHGLRQFAGLHTVYMHQITRSGGAISGLCVRMPMG